MESSYKYFVPDEFKKCVPSCSISDLNPSFLHRLDLARGLAGVPFVLTSAYRSPLYEVGKGRKGTSSHCKGVAVDIRCNDSVSRLKIILSLLDSGFSRIGISKTFIHVDYDTEKPSCIWLY